MCVFSFVNEHMSCCATSREFSQSYLLALGPSVSQQHRVSVRVDRSAAVVSLATHKGELKSVSELFLNYIHVLVLETSCSVSLTTLL